MSMDNWTRGAHPSDPAEGARWDDEPGSEERRRHETNENSEQSDQADDRPQYPSLGGDVDDI